MQSHHQLIDSLAEKADEIKKLTNEKSSQDVTLSFDEINRKWNTFIEGLENQRDTYSKLAEEWNVS